MGLFSTTPIVGLHPGLDRQYTPRDCYEISVITGVGQQVIAGVLTGRIRPDLDVCSRLDPFLGEGTIEMLRNDYDPFRGTEFIETSDIDWHKYRLEERYPASLIRTGDCIKTTDDAWVKISRVRMTPQRVRLFSGESLCAVTKRENRVLTAVLISEVEKGKDREFISERQAQINKVREAFREHVDDEDQQRRADLVYEMLEAARAERRAKEL